MADRVPPGKASGERGGQQGSGDPAGGSQRAQEIARCPFCRRAIECPGCGAEAERGDYWIRTELGERKRVRAWLCYRCGRYGSLGLAGPGHGPGEP